MKLEDIKPGLTVRIAKGHDSGFGGRRGKVEAIGIFESISKRVGALIDIGEPLLVIIDPEGLEKVPEDPLPPGWGVFEI